MNYISTPDELLKRLSAQNGGSIVCSGSCNVLEIACAQADRSGRFYVDERGIGYVLRPETEKTAKQIRADERRKVLEEAAQVAEEIHEPGCPNTADDESDQVLSDYQECVCITSKIVAAINALAAQPEEAGNSNQKGGSP